MGVERIIISNAPGASAADVARRTGTFLGAAITPDMTDAQVMDAGLGPINELVEAAGVPVQYADVVAASTSDDGNITLSGEQLVGGVDLVEGDRTLLIAQDAGVENGLWIVHSGPWTRPTDFDGAGEAVTGATVQVLEGTQAGLWRLTTQGTITIGTTAQTWRAFSYRSATKMSYRAALSGAIPTNVQTALHDLPMIPVTQLGAKGDFDRISGLGTDNTAILQQAIDEAGPIGLHLHFPAGRYMITGELVSNKKLILTSAGPDITEIVMVSATPKAMLRIEIGLNASIIGMKIQGIRWVCDGFGHGVNCKAIVCRGVSGNSQFHSCQIIDNEIANPSIGIDVDATFYRCLIGWNTISTYFGGEVTECGILFETDLDATYNVFIGNEVTSVADGAYAYQIRSNFSTFIDNTSDGYSRISSPGGSIIGFDVETIYADEPPEDEYGRTVVAFNQMGTASGLNFIGVAPDKADYAIGIIGKCTVDSPRCIAPQPDHMFQLNAGSSGVINNAEMLDAVGKLEDIHTSEVLMRWVLNNCGDITNRTTSPKDWPVAPTYTGWSVAPTLLSATYTVNGAVVTAVLTFRGGKITTTDGDRKSVV